MFRKGTKLVCVLVSVFVIFSMFMGCKKGNDNAQKTSTTTSKASQSSSKTSKTTSKATSSSTAAKSTTKTAGTTGQSAQTPGSSSQNNNSDNSAEPVNTDNVSNGETGGNGDTAAPTESAAIDLGGRKIVLKSINDAPVEATPDEIAANPKAGIAYRFWKNAEKKLNFTLEWVKVDQDSHVPDYISATTAGMKYCDILGTRTKSGYPVLPVNGLLVPLEDYIDYSDPLYNTDFFIENTRFMGRIYGFNVPFKTGYGIFYNRNITDMEGIDILNTYIKTGNWTWETMIDIARATTKDLNGDGVIDQWGILLNNNQQAVDMMLFSNGASYVDYRDGKYVFTANEPRAVKALQFVSDMLHSYGIASIDYTNGQSWPSGNGTIIIGKLLSEGKIYKNNYGMNFGFAPLPKGPDVTEYQNVEGNGNNFYAIPVNTDPAIAATVIKEVFTTWDTSKPEHLTKEDMMYQGLSNALVHQEDIDWAFNNYIAPRVSLHKTFNNAWSTFRKEVTEKIIGLETTPAAALQTVESLFNADIANYMGY